MGVVVLARDLAKERLVAVKVLAADAAAHDELRERFRREATTLMRLRCEHVVELLDFGELDSGTPYMVMEYLEGTNLQALVRGNGPLPIETVVEYIVQACEGVAEAHACGIIHRDIKPSNLFLTSRADATTCIKVLDFGVSKVARAALQLTVTDSTLGSPLYMAPEQMRAPKDVDERADIWALGASMFQLLTANKPFNANSGPELYMRVLTTEAPRAKSLRPEVQPGLDAVVARCLERDPNARFADVGELVRALLPFGPAGLTTSVDRISEVVSSQRILPGATIQIAAPPPPPSSRGRLSAPPSSRGGMSGPPSRPSGPGIAPPASVRAPQRGMDRVPERWSFWRSPVAVGLGLVLVLALGIAVGAVVTRWPSLRGRGQFQGEIPGFVPA